MPAIGDLSGFQSGLRDGAAIAAVAVPGDHLDLRMGTQPSFNRGRLAIQQQIDHPASFQIADQRAVALTLAPGPVVDAYDPCFSRTSAIAMSQASQERIFTHRQQEPPPEGLRCTSAQCQRKVADQSLQAGRSPPIGAGQTGIQPFGKDRAAALARAATKSPDLDHEAHVKAMRRQISEAAGHKGCEPARIVLHTQDTPPNPLLLSPKSRSVHGRNPNDRPPARQAEASSCSCAALNLSP